MFAYPVTTPRDVCAVLCDPSFDMPPVPDGAPPGGIRWLRAHVARFSVGADHGRRRAVVTGLLAGVSPESVRRNAFRHTEAALTSGPVELMATIARPVPIRVLAEAVGIPSVPVDAVVTVAADYHPHVEAGLDADRAVARLVEACGGIADEQTAARIGLLVQACDATAGLVGNAVFAMARKENADGERIVDDTLRTDPPVLATTRVAVEPAMVGDLHVAAGTMLRVDLAGQAPDGGKHLTFGAGPRRCPGAEHAIAIAAGILDALRNHRPLTGKPDYAPSPNLRVPLHCEMVPS